MTPIDLRSQFKLDSGKYPFWEGRREYQCFSPRPFVSKFKSIYGLWLEEKLGNSKELRKTYYKETGINPIYPTEHYFLMQNNGEALNSKYTQWLEEKSTD